jgi:hypothetical protein
MKKARSRAATRDLAPTTRWLSASEADTAASVCLTNITCGRRGGGAGGKCRGSDDESKQGEATADHSNLADRVSGVTTSGKVCWRVLR